MSGQTWPCLRSGSAQRSGVAAPVQPRPENGGLRALRGGGGAGQAGRSASPSGQRPRLPETGRGIESLSAGDRRGTGGPGLEAGEAGSSPSEGALGTGPEWGHRGSCPASRPAFHPKEAGGLVSMAATLPGRVPTAGLSPWGRGGVHRAWPPPPGTGLPLAGTSHVAAPKPPVGLGLFPPGAGGQGREAPARRVWTGQPSCRFSHCQDCPRLGGCWPGLGSPLCSGPACDSPAVGELGVPQSPGLTWSLTMDAGAPQAGPTGGCSG